MTKARKAAQATPAAALEDATRIGVKEAGALEAAAAGAVKEGRLLDDAAALTKADLKQIDTVERELVSAHPGLRPSSAVLGTVTSPPLSRLETLFARLSANDRVALGERAIRLARGKSVERALRAQNNMAGQLREIVAKLLPDVVKEVRSVTLRLRAEIRGSSRRVAVDSALAGTVELPTRLKGDQRFIRLGTDRLVGVGTVNPHPIRVRWSDGAEDLLDVAGELDVAVAIEIKGRTNAAEGVGQIIALAQRGQPGYVIIGNELWLLKYDPAKVSHLVVAPPGGNLAAAKEAAALQNAAGRRTRVVEIPRELDDQVKELARNYLTEAAKAQ
jgi:hypothetical protein